VSGLGTTEPALAVLLWSAAAAAATVVGAVPYLVGRQPGRALVGLSDAVAGGLMLGAGYLMMVRALEESTLVAVTGAALGVGYAYWIRRFAGLDGGSPEGEQPEEGAGLDRGYREMLQVALHSALEGIAIGVAMVLDLRFGIFVAGALAVHNIGEGVSLSDVRIRSGIRPRQAAGLALAAKVSQPLLALAIFALAPVLEAVVSGGLGFAAGGLVFLMLAELLPDSYERAPALAVSLVVSVMAGAVVLLESLLL
jgi:zinc transporter ZupT